MSRQDRVNEARKSEAEARAAWYASGNTVGPKWRAFMDAVRRREVEMYLAHDCYGGYGSCISCGCTKGKPCVSHKRYLETVYR